MTPDLNFFLIVFDPVANEVVEQHEFGDAEEAVAALTDAQDAARTVNDVRQVVMFAATSIESLKATHPHYFAGPRTGDTSEFSAIF